MTDIYLIILISIGIFAYFLGGISYIIDFVFNDGFLCETYKNVTTKVGLIVFLMVDIIMLPWAFMYYLASGILLLFEKIIFGRRS